MIADQDRSGWFGASDTDKVIGNWCTKTWLNWWLQKLAVRDDRFQNQYTIAGTHLEHRILESMDIPFMEMDKQIINENLKLRVNLDGNDEDTIYEVKTFRLDKGFKMPKKYINQVQVQMFATGYRKAYILAYGLEEADYDNFFRPIDKSRLQIHPIAYDEQWVSGKYLPRLERLAYCLKEGVIPDEANV